MPQALIAKLIGLPAICAACLWLGYEWRDREAEAQMAHLQTQHAQARETQSKNLAAAEKQYRDEEKRKADLLLENLNESHTKLLKAQADAAAARGSSDRLQKRVAALLAAGAANSSAVCPAAPGGPTANASGDLLADMFRRLDEAAGTIGEYADRARVAGETCQRANSPVSTP